MLRLIYPHLSGKIFGAHLPFSAKSPQESHALWQLLDVDGRPVFPLDSNQVQTENDYWKSKNSNLSDNECSVLSACSKKQFLIRRNVENLLSCRATKATEILNSLVDKGFLDKIGDGKAIRYKRR